jgi:hypothetical protein
MSVGSWLKGQWNALKNDFLAADHLIKAIEDDNIEKAVEAISQASPLSEISHDDIIDVISQYQRREFGDLELLDAMRKAVYENFDSKYDTAPRSGFYVSESLAKEYYKQTSYVNPLAIYAMAAYMNDVDKLKELNELGIEPDMVTGSVIQESIIMGTAHKRAFDAMKEVISQGASIHLKGNMDDFSPAHYITRPLFQARNPGVKQALLQTENQEIIHLLNGDKHLSSHNRR